MKNLAENFVHIDLWALRPEAGNCLRYGAIGEIGLLPLNTMIYRHIYLNITEIREIKIGDYGCHHKIIFTNAHGHNPGFYIGNFTTEESAIKALIEIGIQNPIKPLSKRSPKKGQKRTKSKQASK